MYFKKLLAGIATAALVSCIFVLPVSAHGHHGHYNQTASQTECPVCTFEGCTEEGRHTHDGCYYCGYDHEDGYCDGSCAAVSRRGHGRHHCRY